VKCFYAVDRFLEKIENAFVIIILSIMILLSFLQIILRNIFSTSISWGDIFLRHLVLWIGFIGASLAIRENKHINIDVLTKLLTSRIKKIVQAVVNLFAAVICYFLMQASITFIHFEKEGASTLFSNVPVWMAQLIIVIGFGIMMFRFSVRFLEMIFSFGKSTMEMPA